MDAEDSAARRPAPGWGRLLAAGVAGIAAASITGQVLAALVAAGDGAAGPGSIALALVTLGAVAVLVGRREIAVRAIAMAVGGGAGFAGLMMSGQSPLAAVAAVLPAVGLGLVLPGFAGRFPPELDGWMRRRPVVAVLWSVLAVLAVANTARIAIFMVDDTQVWASFFPPLPESARHQCAAAYVRAGELAAEDAANVYDVSHYGVFGSPDDSPPTGVAGLRPYLSDPFEYPPTFLFLPRAGLAVSNDFDVLRAGWFAIQALAFLAACTLLALWIGGRAGAVSLLLVPALLFSAPLLMSWQWGQFHATVIALSVVAMLAFATRRDWIGGALLAVGTGTKLFPGALLIQLVAGRPRGTRLRVVLTTLVGGLALVGVALLLVGVQPFRSFFDYQLPRIASGEAFWFTETNPDNYSPYGLVFKLRTLGVPGMGRGLAVGVSWIYLAIVVLLAVSSGRRARSRAELAVSWLALLSLASLRSPFAPTYAGISTLWLLAIWAGARERRSRWSTAGIVVAWILLQGVPPIGSAAGDAIASLPAQLVAIAVPLLAVWPRGARAGHRGETPARATAFTGWGGTGT